MFDFLNGPTRSKVWLLGELCPALGQLQTSTLGQEETFQAMRKAVRC